MAEYIVPNKDLEGIGDMLGYKELIRCKDCKYWDGHWAGLSFTMCNAFDWKSKAEDFCSFAERKEK